MKKIEKIGLIIGIIIILYIILCFIEVNTNNGIQGGIISKYNIFKILLSVLENLENLE